MTHTEPDRRIFGGVDTHGRTHHAAVIDELGRYLAYREFPAATAGYRQLHAFLAAPGDLARSTWRAPAPTAPGRPATWPRKASTSSTWTARTARPGG
jgi:hypothetical protein